MLGGNSFPATLSPGQAIVVSVQFDPASAGTATGQLTFSTNAGSRSVSLGGAGTAAAALGVNATSIAFGNVYLNTPAEQAITLSSTGTAPVTVNSVTITGTGFTESGASFPVTLNPGQSATVNVQFDPASAGVFTGQLTIASSASTDSLPMTGTGQAHQVRLSWTAPAGSTDPVTGYNIYRASSGTNGLQRVNGTADMQTVYVDTAVQSGSTYDYLVKSVDASGVESAASNMATASIP